ADHGAKSKFIHPQVAGAVHGRPGSAAVGGFHDLAARARENDIRIVGVDDDGIESVVQHVGGQQRPVHALVGGFPQTARLTTGEQNARVVSGNIETVNIGLPGDYSLSVGVVGLFGTHESPVTFLS